MAGSEQPTRQAVDIQCDTLADHRSNGMDSESIRRLATDDAVLKVEALARWTLMLPCAFEFAMLATACAAVQLPQSINDFCLEHPSFQPQFRDVSLALQNNGVVVETPRLVC